MKPHVVCHMITSLDGGLHPSRWTNGVQGGRAEWSSAYERIHQALEGDAWIVGRKTMAEMSKAAAHAPTNFGAVDRPRHIAAGGRVPYAVVLDPAGKIHFSGPDVQGDPVVALLGRDAPDSHLAELAADGVSYIVADGAELDMPKMLDELHREFAIRRLLLEGGATINGAFFAAGLVDELSLLVAPALDGRSSIQSIVEHGQIGLAGKVRLSLSSFEALEHGLLHLRYTIHAA
jgi:riboflavin biosynthesis pyrimidine reductase